jgi:hypothetical protein
MIPFKIFKSMEIGEYAHRFLLEKAKYINRDSTPGSRYLQVAVILLK